MKRLCSGLLTDVSLWETEGGRREMFKMFCEILLLLLIGVSSAKRNISVSLGDLQQPDNCQDFLSRFEVYSFV